TPRRRCSGCAPTTSASRRAGTSTPGCWGSAAPMRPISPSPGCLPRSSCWSAVPPRPSGTRTISVGRWGRAVLGVMGPASPQLLARLSRADLSDAAFGFAASREIDLGYSTVRATRITYVGELGWELSVPAEFAAGVYEDLMAAGADLGAVNAGYYAIESLRLEKAYRAFGREVNPD